MPPLRSSPKLLTAKKRCNGDDKEAPPTKRQRLDDDGDSLKLDDDPKDLPSGQSTRQLLPNGSSSLGKQPSPVLGHHSPKVTVPIDTFPQTRGPPGAVSWQTTPYDCRQEGSKEFGKVIMFTLPLTRGDKRPLPPHNVYNHVARNG